MSNFCSHGVDKQDSRVCPYCENKKLTSYNKTLEAVAFVLLILLILSGCYQSNNNYDIRIAIRECDKAELRSVWIHNLEGEYAIQCRPYKNE